MKGTRMRRRLRAGLFAAAMLVAPMAMACMEPRVPSFRELLPKARSIVIVRIESISLLPQRSREIVMVPEQVARVRVAEVIAGRMPETELVRFSGLLCGGHNLQVGEYYVLLVERDARIIELAPNAESIVYLFGQYKEREGHRNSRSDLLMHLRNFASTGHFPDDFPVGKFLEHNRVPWQPAPQP